MVLHWLARVRELSKPLPMLVFEGAAGGGKDLFCDAVARVFTFTPRSRLEDLFSPFNGDVLGNPLTVAEEQLPRGNEGRVTANQLKSAISGRGLYINKKFKDRFPVRGCLRFIATSNSPLYHQLTGDYTTQDIDALAQRIIHIPVSEEAAEFLVRRGARFGEDLVGGDLLARHILALEEELAQAKRDGTELPEWARTTQGNRFAVQSDAAEMKLLMTTGTGLRQPILDIMCKFVVCLAGAGKPSSGEWQSGFPGQQGRENCHGLIVEDGFAWTRTDTIMAAWGNYGKGSPLPVPGAVGRALGTMSKGRGQLVIDGRPVNYAKVPLQYLEHRLSEDGYTLEQVVELIDKAKAASAQIRQSIRRVKGT